MDLGTWGSTDRAFTLLEVVVAMLLLCVALVGLMALQIRSVRSNTFSNCMTVASCLARNHVESLRASSSADWDSMSDGVFSETLSDMAQETGSARMVYTRRWEVKTDPEGRMRLVAVTVSWSQDGSPHRIDVSTQIAKRE